MVEIAYGMAPAGGGDGGGGLIGFLPLILMFVILYLLLFYPQQRKQKRHQEMLTRLKKGDRVVTSGGIHGTVVGVKEAIVVLRIADKVKIEVEKGMISVVKGENE